MTGPTLPPILWWSAQLSEPDGRDWEPGAAPGVIVEASRVWLADHEGGWVTLSVPPPDARRLVVDLQADGTDEPSAATRAHRRLARELDLPVGEPECCVDELLRQLRQLRAELDDATCFAHVLNAVVDHLDLPDDAPIESIPDAVGALRTAAPAQAGDRT